MKRFYYQEPPKGMVPEVRVEGAKDFWVYSEKTQWQPIHELVDTTRSGGSWAPNLLRFIPAMEFNVIDAPVEKIHELVASVCGERPDGSIGIWGRAVYGLKTDKPGAVFWYFEAGLAWHPDPDIFTRHDPHFVIWEPLDSLDALWKRVPQYGPGSGIGAYF